MAKAFDTINRDLLMYKLFSNSLSSKFINTIKSLYCNNTACMKTKLGYTETFPIKIGTRQGCNLSPLLFNLYLNDLPQYLNNCGSNLITLNNEKVSCLLYADDIVLLNESKTGLEKSLSLVENYCNKWQLNVNISKTKILIFNRKFNSCLPPLKLCGKPIEYVKSFVYLGIEISNTGSFNPAISRLCSKATRAYYSLKQEFNIYNNTNPKVIMKLYETMIVPILTYGSEIWGCFGWSKQNKLSIQNYLFNQKVEFEKLQAKICKNTLGIAKQTPDVTAKAELGIYPLTTIIVKNIFAYWQHILNASENSLIHNCLVVSVNLDRNNVVSYYTRIKKLPSVLDMRQEIYKVPIKNIKSYSNKLKTRVEELYT